MSIINKNFLFIVFMFLLFGCKVKLEYPSEYYDIQREMDDQNYQEVLNLINTKKIKNKYKTDWYYFDRAIAFYNIRPSLVRNSIDDLLIAKKFTPEDFKINYYLGKMYFEICDYSKAKYYFSQIQNCIDNDIPYGLSPEIWIMYLECLTDNNDFSLILNKFYPEINFDNNIISIIKDISNLRLSDYNNIFIFNLYFSNNIKLKESDYIEIMKMDISKVLKCLFRNKLIFSYLADKKYELIKEVLINENVMDPESGAIFLDTKESMVSEELFKLLSFNYYFEGDYTKANVMYNIYYQERYKPLKYEYLMSDNLDNFIKEFCNDSQFKFLSE